MKLYGFVGKSGSGKSHHAVELAESLKIDCIIDDGLLIYKGIIRAGYSAKFEPTAIAAVRRAVFVDPAHREQVRQALDTFKPDGCLILGTSRRMIYQICQRLNLPFEEIEWISIESVVSPSQIQIAAEMRERGMHAIPLLQTHLQPLSPISSLVQRMLQRVRVVPTAKMAAKASTIVRPMFADGGIYIHPRVVRDSLEYLLRDHHHPFRLRELVCDTEDTARFEVLLHAEWQPDLKSSAVRLLHDVTAYLQENFGFPYPQVHIRIVSISPPLDHQRSARGFRKLR